MLVASKGLQAQALLPGEIAQLKFLATIIEQRAETYCPTLAPQLREAAARIRAFIPGGDIDDATRAVRELGPLIEACRLAKNGPGIGAGTQRHDL